MLFKPRQDRAELRVAVVGDVDELGGHAGIDVHLGMAHVSHKFNAHQLHFVVDEVACAIARVRSQHDLSAGVGFDRVHHFQRLHFEPLRDLQSDESMVVGADALHQFFQFEIVAVQIHGAPQWMPVTHAS